MGDGILMIIDLITIGAGVALIVSPTKTYNWGNKDENGRQKEHREPPKKWFWQARVIGAIFILVGGFLLTYQFVNGGGGA